MSVDVAHLVLETSGNTNDQVVDDGTDGTEGGNLLTGAMVQFDRDDVLLGTAKCDGDVRKVFDEFAPGSLDGDDSRFDMNFHYSNKRSESVIVREKMQFRFQCHLLPARRM